MNKRILVLALVSTIGYLQAKTETAPNTSAQVPAEFSTIEMTRKLKPADLLYFDVTMITAPTSLKKQFMPLVTQLSTSSNPSPIMTNMQKLKLAYAFANLTMDDQTKIISHLPRIFNLMGIYNVMKAKPNSMSLSSTGIVTDPVSQMQTAAYNAFVQDLSVKAVVSIFNKNIKLAQ